MDWKLSDTRAFTQIHGSEIGKKGWSKRNDEYCEWWKFQNGGQVLTDQFLTDMPLYDCSKFRYRRHWDKPIFWAICRTRYERAASRRVSATLWSWPNGSRTSKMSARAWFTWRRLKCVVYSLGLGSTGRSDVEILRLTKRIVCSVTPQNHFERKITKAILSLHKELKFPLIRTRSTSEVQELTSKWDELSSYGQGNRWAGETGARSIWQPITYFAQNWAPSRTFTRRRTCTMLSPVSEIRKTSSVGKVGCLCPVDRLNSDTVPRISDVEGYTNEERPIRSRLRIDSVYNSTDLKRNGASSRYPWPCRPLKIW